MKKFLIILPMAVAAVFLSGCGNAPVATESGNAVPTQKQEADKSGIVGSAIGSLKDAIGLGKKMECVSKDASGETKAYIDGMKYKAVSATPEGNMISIFDGADFHTWNEKTKQGFVMTKACMDELSERLPKTDGTDNVSGNNNLQTTEDVIADESMDNCKETGPIDFTIPSDVKFVDQCELLKNIPANLKDFKIPTGQ